MLSHIYGAQLLVLRVSRDAWRDAETRDQGRSVRFWKCTHTQTREICENFLETFSKGHFNKWKNEKHKIKLQHYKCLLSEKSTNFSSTHMRICEKDATPLIFRMFLHFAVQPQNRPFFAMLLYCKLKIFTKIGRWKSCHFYNMRSVSKPLCIEELWYSYRVV